jgi:hypothetical protein
MRIEFGKDDTLIIMAENSIEAMALKYWKGEFEEHGEKVLHVSTDYPIQLAHNNRE